MLTTQKFLQEYSPYINHFIQPDTIIPNPADPQSWNRYSYVQNNPIRYTDPTGHRICGADEVDSKCDSIIELTPILVEVDKDFDPYTGAVPDGINYDESALAEADNAD